MEKFNDITVRAEAALKCLGVETPDDLYFIEIPPVGTVLKKGFMGIGRITLTSKTREEIISLQEEVIREIHHDAEFYMAQQMLDNPEDYGLI